MMDENISKSIDFLRFPLAIAVVFLHLPGQYTNWSEWSWYSWANFSGCDILSLSTNVLFQVAVPIFFFISGYLFSDLIMPFVISGVCVVFYNLLEKECPKLLAQLTGARNLK